MIIIHVTQLESHPLLVFCGTNKSLPFSYY